MGKNSREAGQFSYRRGFTFDSENGKLMSSELFPTQLRFQASLNTDREN